MTNATIESRSVDYNPVVVKAAICPEALNWHGRGEKSRVYQKPIFCIGMYGAIVMYDRPIMLANRLNLKGKSGRLAGEKIKRPDFTYGFQKN